MGWTFGCATKAELVARLVKDQPASPEYQGCHDYRTIVHAVRGKVLWTVQEHKSPGVEGPWERFIGCYFLDHVRGAGPDGRDWGWKDCDEGMHPYEYSCPLSYLAMAPVACQAWRDGVVAYHARPVLHFGVGDVAIFRNGCKPDRVTVTSVRPLQGTFEGRTYRIPRKAVDRVMTAEEYGAHLRLKARIEVGDTTPADPVQQSLDLGA